MATYQNDGKFPDGSSVLTPFPLRSMTAETPRESWPWITGVIEQQCGPDEWQVTITDRSMAELEDGTAAADGTPEEEVFYPGCFRDASEIRPVQ
jgi:hypothetical protein